MSEDHRRPFNGEIKIKFLTEDDCQYSGIAGLLQIELDQHYNTQAKWIGEETDFEKGLQEIGKAYMTMRRHWEMRRQRILAEEREAMEPALVEPTVPEGVDLGEETDKHEVVL